jgi:hypothetical protein
MIVRFRRAIEGLKEAIVPGQAYVSRGSFSPARRPDAVAPPAQPNKNALARPFGWLRLGRDCAPLSPTSSRDQAWSRRGEGEFAGLPPFGLRVGRAPRI